MDNLPMILGNSLIGFMLVFIVLVVLMIFITLMNKVFSSLEKKTETAEPVQAQTSVKKDIPEVTLTNVSERDAAMIMAIVADESGIPLSELRFISIKEVENDEV